MDEVIRRRPMIPKWLKIAIACAAVIAVVTFAFLGVSQGARNVRVSSRGLEVATVQEGLFLDFVPIRGKTVPRDMVYMDAQEGGRVERIAVENGDAVTAGDVLVEFGNTALQLEVIDRETLLIQQIDALRSSEYMLEQTRMANERSISELDNGILQTKTRLGRLNAPGTRDFSAAEERDLLAQQLAHFSNLRLRMQASHAKQEDLRLKRLPEIADGLEKLRQNLQVTRQKMDGLFVRAPISGRVSGFSLTVGEICSRGQRIAQITPATGFKVVANVDEFYSPRVFTGQQATLQYRDRDVPATVTRISTDVVNGQFTVDLAFQDAGPSELLAGQGLEGKLQLGKDERTRYLPAGSFINQTGGRWILALSPEGDSATRRSIQIGRRTTRQIEILDGLAVGERVIVSDYRSFANADTLQITD
jgi:HlyD family secretion protein